MFSRPILATPFRVTLASTLIAASVRADLPDAPGKAATIRICGKCHSPERAISKHQTHSEWEDTVIKMVKLGAQGSDEELEAVLSYLSKNFGPQTPGPININKARPIELQAALLLLRSQAEALVQYRNTHGDFKSLADLRNVPGLDFQKIDSKKSRIVF